MQSDNRNNSVNQSTVMSQSSSFITVTALSFRTDIILWLNHIIPFLHDYSNFSVSDLFKAVYVFLKYSINK